VSREQTPGVTAEFLLEIRHGTLVSDQYAVTLQTLHMRLVSRILLAALTFVAAQGSVAFGFGIMFTYALGMGLLFFLIGAFSIHLPKSGAWMETVKSIFGVALLAAAGIFLKDAFPQVKPLFSAAREAAFVAAGLAALGVLAGALHASFDGPVLQRVAKGLGVALLVGGIVYAIGAAGARERARSAAAFAWLHSEEEAIALAKAEGRPVLVDFWAEWCTACKELDRTAFADARVREALSRFVTVKVDATNDTEEVAALLDKYGVVGMPTLVFIDRRGHEVPVRVTGAIEAEEMLKWVGAVDRACLTPVVACVTRW
jgi:thiol:disulfide interchange protein DsbD